MRGRGACVMGVCMEGGMHGGGGVHGRGYVWQGGVHGRGGGEIRSMSGRYASYWNAFLLNV